MTVKKGKMVKVSIELEMFVEESSNPNASFEEEVDVHCKLLKEGIVSYGKRAKNKTISVTSMDAEWATQRKIKI